MVRLRAIAASTLLCLVVLFTFPRRAQAYLDPGTGSYLLQVLLAGLLAGILVVRIFWRSIKAFLRGLFARGCKPGESSTDDR